MASSPDAGESEDPAETAAEDGVEEPGESEAPASMADQRLAAIRKNLSSAPQGKKSALGSFSSGLKDAGGPDAILAEVTGYSGFMDAFEKAKSGGDEALRKFASDLAESVLSRTK
jgi:hypothetical protein